MSQSNATPGFIAADVLQVSQFEESANAMEAKSKWRLKIITRAGLARLALLGFAAAVLLTSMYFTMLRMPGKSFAGPLPPLEAQQAAMAQRLRRDVTMLAETIGERNLFRPKQLEAAAEWLEQELQAMGYTVARQTYTANLPEYHIRGMQCANIEAQLPGAARADEIIVIGAHYDTVFGSPGANDNGSGVAALLEVARHCAATSIENPPDRTLRFVCFVNEEPPFFQTDTMGSRVYARRCRERGENIVGMISLETIGYYSDAPKTQSYPAPFGAMYPSSGNFIGFVSNVKSRQLLREVVATFRDHARFPSEGAALFGTIAGVGWSDHWSFWQEGYAGLMVTDTAIFRYPHYHEPTDTPDKLDYPRMARVVEGMLSVVEALVRPAAPEARR